MIESHAKRLSNFAHHLADPEQHREMIALAKEEADRAEAIRPQEKKAIRTWKLHSSLETPEVSQSELPNANELSTRPDALDLASRLETAHELEMGIEA